MKKAPIDSKKIQNKSSIDLDLWNYVATSVKPLPKNQKNRASEKEIWPTSQHFSLEHNQSDKTPYSLSKNLNQPAPLPELNHNSHAGLDKSNAKKLKKGQHPIEGQIDLHGMTQKKAYTAINSFIQNSFNARKRCILIITGKGNKLDGSVGVLRLAVPRWLNEEPNRSCILAFSYAMPKDGGEGALYILLKKKR